MRDAVWFDASARTKDALVGGSAGAQAKVTVVVLKKTFVRVPEAVRSGQGRILSNLGAIRVPSALVPVLGTDKTVSCALSVGGRGTQVGQP